MGMTLTGSAQTGSKIREKWNLFSFSLVDQVNKENETLYRFEWNLGGQIGTISIYVRTSDNKMSTSSLIDTNRNSQNCFARPLGLYNDPSLESVFNKMLSSIDVKTNGVYSDDF